EVLLTRASGRGEQAARPARACRRRGRGQRDVRFPRERRITQTRICTALQAQLERQRRGSGARGRERNGHFDRAAINLLSTEELVLVIFSARPLRLAELHARERRGDVHLVLIEVVAA